MPLTWRDDRSVHVVTRGNVDGIVSAALAFSVHPRLRMSFVPSASGAVEALRKDLSSRLLYVIDVGLTAKLVKTINNKRHTAQAVTYIDHHQQSAGLAAGLDGAEVYLADGISAATAAYHYWGLNGEHQHLAALADVVEFCSSEERSATEAAVGRERLVEEARMLDFAWRYEIEDDRFRASVARRLAAGSWPSEIEELRRRYHKIESEDLWSRALDRVRTHLFVAEGIGILDFGKRRPSLYGFGTRALAAVAKEEGCRVAVLLNRRRHLTAISLRSLTDGTGNLGRYVDRFTAVHGVLGGGHPQSAGAKIHTRDVPVFLEGLRALA